MNIIPNVQSLVIISVVAASLFTLIAIIFYKLGKREKVKVIQGKNIKSKEDYGIALQQSRSSETEKTIEGESKNINNEDKFVNDNPEEKTVSSPDLYSKKVGEEINNTELNDIIENDKIHDFKFLKYTSNGYKPAIGDKESRILRWR